MKHARYVIVGAALVQLSDGRCALFTVSTHVAHSDLLMGTLQQRRAVAAAQAANKEIPKQQPNYPLDAETSVLELPPDCVSVEVQIATSSVLVRIAERKSTMASVMSNNGMMTQMMMINNMTQQQRHGHHNQQVLLSGSVSPIASSTVLCLALDSSGRPIGAASMRGRALGPFSSGMVGVKALWRISAADGACSGNLQAGPGGILESWVLGGGGGGGGKGKVLTRSNNVNGNVASQHHQIVACTWLEPLVLMRGAATAFVGGASTHNISGFVASSSSSASTSFSCLSVISSEWREVGPAGACAGGETPYLTTRRDDIMGGGCGGVGGGEYNNTNTNDFVDHAVCSVLLSQMAAHDPSDTLRGFQHRKLCSFARPDIFAPLVSNLDTAGASVLNSDGTLLLLVAPNAHNVSNLSRMPAAGYSVAAVVLSLPVGENNVGVGESGDVDSTFFSGTGAGAGAGSPTDLVSSTVIAATNPTATFSSMPRSNKNCCVVTFQIQCTHSNSAIHAGAPCQMVFCGSSRKAAVFCSPVCGCCAFVPDVLRAPPLLLAEPVLGFGVMNPLAALGLRNTDKFPIVPRISRTILAPPPPSSALNQRQLASALTQASFLEQSTANNGQMFGFDSSSGNNNGDGSNAIFSSSVPFLFAGLPLGVDTKSGSALALVLAAVRSCNANMANNTATSPAAGAGVGGTATMSRLLESIGAEAVFLTQQYRALDPAFFFAAAAAAPSSSNTTTATATNMFLKMAGLALLESFFRRVGHLATLCNNLFTRRSEDFHLFDAALLQLARFSEVLLAAFKSCFVDKMENADLSAMHAENRARIDETGAHFVAAAFVGPVSKLLHLGLVSVAARVAHTVGDHCPYLVDLVYPTAAQLYRRSATYPSAGSFVHDIEPLLSEQGQALLGKLETIRHTAAQKQKAHEASMFAAAARF